MKSLFFLRHFPTLANHADVFMGRNDIDISPDYDRYTLFRLQKQITEEQLDLVYSSPLTRCIHTAQLVCPKCEIIIDSRILEKDLGDWQGKEKKEVVRMYPKYFTEDGKLKVTMRPPNGEDNSIFVNRVISFINEIINNKSIDKCLIVTHGGVISCIRQLIDQSDNDEAVDTHTVQHGILYKFNFSHIINYK